jgi:hypothetical protein
LKFIQKYICANRLAIIAKWYETFGLWKYYAENRKINPSQRRSHRKWGKW